MPLGGQDGTPPKVGWTEARVSWRPITFIPIQDTANPGDSFLEVRQSTASVTLSSDVNNVNVTGVGLTREANTTELVIRAFKADSAPLSAWIGIQNSLNSNAIATPDMRGLPGSAITIGAKQGLARTLEMRPARDGVVEFVFHIGYGPIGSWDAIYEPQSNLGVLIGDQTAVLYESKAWPSTLW